MKHLIEVLAFLRIVKRRCPAMWQRNNIASTEHWQCGQPVHSTGEHRWRPRHGRWIFLHLDPYTVDVLVGLAIALLVAACAVVPWLCLADAAGGSR